MNSITELSLLQAQKLVILQQKLFFNAKSAQGKEATLQSIQHMGYVQIDSISVIARAHHHSLYNRVRNYSQTHLDSLLEEQKIFEYWSHAAAYLPMKDYKFSLPRKLALKSGERHWFKKDQKVMDYVLARITDKGPLMAKDFSSTANHKNGWWDWKPAKIALEQLFMQGDLMVTQRRGFQKVYDLTHRVLPASIDTQAPSTAEYCEFLILQYLKNQGVAKAEHFAYLLKGMKADIKQQLQIMLEKGQLLLLSIAGQQYYTQASSVDLLQLKLAQQKVKILSPFDNLIIQRKRMLELFNFNYQIECYVPAAKRVYGYFSLPILQGQVFVGRMDVKMHRKDQLMSIQHLHLHTTNLEKLQRPLAQSINDFMHFQQAEKLQIERVSTDELSKSNTTAVLTKASLNSFKLALEQQAR
ncbi:MAG: crosslink repair DNA glycosylase YcaQ family protein [Oceanospirillaceae bacterium]